MTSLLCTLLQLYLFVVLVRIVFSWFPLRAGGVAQQIAAVLTALTEPVLGPLRRVIPSVPLGGMRLDLSPLILIFGITIVQGMIGCG
jgi:YggT family protein